MTKEKQLDMENIDDSNLGIMQDEMLSLRPANIHPENQSIVLNEE